MARRTNSLRWLTTLVMSALLTLAAAPADAQKKGGVLRIGNLGEPPALDAHNGSITAVIASIAVGSALPISKAQARPAMTAR